VRVVAGEVFDVAVDHDEARALPLDGRSFRLKTNICYGCPKSCAQHVLSDWAELVYKATGYLPRNGSVYCAGMTEVGVQWPVPPGGSAAF
jgi:hypothetical protein